MKMQIIMAVRLSKSKILTLICGLFMLLVLSCKSDSSFIGHWKNSDGRVIKINREGSQLFVKVSDRYPDRFTASYSDGALMLDANNVTSKKISIDDNGKVIYFESEAYTKQ